MSMSNYLAGLVPPAICVIAYLARNQDAQANTVLQPLRRATGTPAGLWDSRDIRSIVAHVIGGRWLTVEVVDLSVLLAGALIREKSIAVKSGLVLLELYRFTRYFYWLGAWVRKTRPVAPTVATWVHVAMNVVGTNDPLIDCVDIDDLELDEEVVAKTPWIVRKYVQKLQLTYGVPRRTESNVLTLRKRLNLLLEEDDVRHADRVRYSAEILTKVFIPSSNDLAWALAPKASQAVAIRTSLYDASRAAEN